MPRLESLVNWCEHLLQIQDLTKVFSCYPNNTLQHLFADGSCTVPAHPCLTLASWGVLNATSGELVALGHLAGLTQPIDRAELSAIVAAVRWTTRADLCIWSDSLSTVTTAVFIQQHPSVPTALDHYDLWTDFLDALGMRDGQLTLFRWTPSHVHDETLAEDPFEEWVFRWNNVIDPIV